MAKIWLIAKHEYLTNIRRRSFLFGAFGIPVITLIMMTLVFGLVIDNEADVSRLGTIGYVDQAGVLAAQIDLPKNFSVYASDEAARAALDAGTIGAYFSVDANYLNNGAIQVVSLTGIPAALTDAINTYLRANLSAGLDPAIAERIKDPVESSIRTLDNGRELQGSAIVGLFLMPILFVMIFLFASQTTSSYMMSGVVEEKVNRIMEILITSVTPLQLLVGKMLGLGLLGLTQLGVWLAGGYLTLTISQQANFLTGVTIPTDLVVVGLIYFVLGYFLLSSVMAAIGVIVGSEQESRQYAALFTMGMVIPFFLISSFITDPSGAAVTFLTLFPLTSPIAVILLMGFGSIPWWQLGASIILLLFTSILFAWGAARIFRWGLLLYGKRPGLRELLRVMRRPPVMATTASGEGSSRS